jgi:DNA repair exonuclease SbcCD nuclease subunit
MTRLLVLSDLHLEFGVPLDVPEDAEFDVVVLAGDIHNPGKKAVRWAQEQPAFVDKPVLLVPGNHEYYDALLNEELEAMRRSAQGSNVQVLSRDEVTIDGVRFLGCTLWTDFAVPIVSEADPASEDIDIERSLREANRCVMDFRLIDVTSPLRSEQRHREVKRPLRAEDTLAMHWVERDWLRRKLAHTSSHCERTVVVTHHAPAKGSIARMYATSWVTPAFVSDLPAEMFERVDLWIHGHTHAGFDYRKGNCRVVSNPRGYTMRDGSLENGAFNAGLIVVV